MFPNTDPAVLQDFELFAQSYRPGILAWCRSRGLQDADAEDQTQRVLLQLLDRRRAIDYDPARGPFRNYLVGVLWHALIDRIRDQARHPEEPQDVGGTAHNAMMHQIEDRAVDDLVTSVIDVPATAEWEAICRVKAKVDPKTWECFELRKREGWAPADVAEATGKTKGAVYTAVYRVRELIDEEYQQVLRERQPEARAD